MGSAVFRRLISISIMGNSDFISTYPLPECNLYYINQWRSFIYIYLFINCLLNNRSAFIQPYNLIRISQCQILILLTKTRLSGGGCVMDISNGGALITYHRPFRILMALHTAISTVCKQGYLCWLFVIVSTYKTICQRYVFTNAVSSLVVYK